MYNDLSRTLTTRNCHMPRFRRLADLIDACRRQAQWTCKI